MHDIITTTQDVTPASSNNSNKNEEGQNMRCSQRKARMSTAMIAIATTTTFLPISLLTRPGDIIVTIQPIKKQKRSEVL